MASLVPCLIRAPIPKVHLKLRHLGMSLKKKVVVYGMHFFFLFALSWVNKMKLGTKASLIETLSVGI